uniref:PARN like ribonuclease domain containing exonuclease 1 n=1 Tax=Chelonoidis abingdonii TaxID=106734 RepID=A0A8C0QL22_CHEAB
NKASILGENVSEWYVAHSYNFFLFPTTFGVMDSEFSFQASSIQFLTHYGFDYNKFLKDGIPYTNEVQEKKLQQGLLTGNWKVRSTLDKDKVKKVIDDVTRWVPSAEEGGSMVLHDISGMKWDSFLICNFSVAVTPFLNRWGLLLVQPTYIGACLVTLLLFHFKKKKHTQLTIAAAKPFGSGHVFITVLCCCLFVIMMSSIVEGFFFLEIVWYQWLFLELRWIFQGWE